MLALVHAPSPLLAVGQRTHVAWEAIDFERVQKQHAAYCQALVDCGLQLRVLNINRDAPDGVFVEDTAIVLDEVAIVCSMGTAARRHEPLAIEPALREFREVRRIEWPALIEGGDVLRVDRELLVGLSSRTSAVGVEALANLVRPVGYTVNAVTVRGCLHLKTACTALPDGRLLVNPAWLDTSALRGRSLIQIPTAEPWAANTLPIGHASSCPLPTCKQPRSFAVTVSTRSPSISQNSRRPREA